MHKKLVPIGIACAAIWFVVEYGWVLTVMKGPIAVNKTAGIPWHDPTAHGMAALAAAAILFGFSFAAIFLKGYEGQGMVEGVRFAIWVTLLASVMENIAWGAGIDVGRHMIGFAIAGDFVTFVLCGLAAAAMAGGRAQAAKA